MKARRIAWGGVYSRSVCVGLERDDGGDSNSGGGRCHCPIQCQQVGSTLLRERHIERVVGGQAVALTQFTDSSKPQTKWERLERDLHHFEVRSDRFRDSFGWNAHHGVRGNFQTKPPCSAAHLDNGVRDLKCKKIGGRSRFSWGQWAHGDQRNQSDRADSGLLRCRSSDSLALHPAAHEARPHQSAAREALRRPRRHRRRSLQPLPSDLPQFLQVQRPSLSSTALCDDRSIRRTLLEESALLLSERGSQHFAPSLRRAIGT